MINQKQRFLNFLGIAQRAGKIISGENLLLKQFKSRQIRFLILALDAGQATQKKFCDKARFYRIPLNNQFTKVALFHAIGRNRTVIGIVDPGFANRLIELNQKIKGQ